MSANVGNLSQIEPVARKRKAPPVATSEKKVSTKEELTCEVLVKEKEKLDAEILYLKQKTQESIAIQQAAISKKNFFDFMLSQRQNIVYSHGTVYQNL